MVRTALFSPDGRYRYRLGRRWATSGPTVAWIMLNPSTADSSHDDPTVRRVVSFSRSWGFGGCEVVNLFAFRSTDARTLVVVDDPVGPSNVVVVGGVLEECARSGAGVIVLAWGAGGQRLMDVARPVIVAASSRWGERRLTPVSLGPTKSGAPRHPLYVPAATRPRPVPTDFLAPLLP